MSGNSLFIDRALALVLSAAIISLSLVSSRGWSPIGVSIGCPLLQRLVYPFFHVSFIHAALNLWCFLSVVFLHRLHWSRIVAGYLIAVFIPPFVLSSIPTVGFSVVCYALLGMISFLVSRRCYFIGCIALYIVSGFFIPLINGLAHLYGYAAGLFFGLLTSPFPCAKK